MFANSTSKGGDASDSVRRLQRVKEDPTWRKMKEQ